LFELGASAHTCIGVNGVLEPIRSIPDASVTATAVVRDLLCTDTIVNVVRPGVSVVVEDREVTCIECDVSRICVAMLNETHSG
jgi:hypothetical protein